VTRDPLDCEVVLTRGGARAMLDRTSGEVMHPGVGPLEESARLYVGSSRLCERLEEPGPEPLVLLDVGLGAGSNAAAAFGAALRASATARRLEIVSFDHSVAALTLAVVEEHRASFGLTGEAGDAARELLRTHRYQGTRASWRLSLGALPGSLETEPRASADIVFWDPFSPRQNPELWSVAAFCALRPLCREGATVHTYSRATATRTALLLAGFAVGFGEAAGDKQETTTVAATRADDLAQPLDARWLERLSRSSAPFPPDAPSDAFARIRALAQFAKG
jgi:queuine tRNA-ribosyltransferase